MTLDRVLLICSVGIALCAALVFAVETIVAFCLHEQQIPEPAQGSLLAFEETRSVLPEDEALPVNRAA